MPIIDLIFEEGNPAGIKAVLASKELIKENVRLPVVKTTAQLRKKIDTYLAQ